MYMYVFIHSFILKTSIAPLQDTTSLLLLRGAHSPVTAKEERVEGNVKFGRARNAAQRGDHFMMMGPQPKRPFAAQWLNGPEGPKAHPSQQNAAPDALPKPTLGSRGHKGQMGRSEGHTRSGDYCSNTILYPLRDSSQYCTSRM